MGAGRPIRSAARVITTRVRRATAAKVIRRYRNEDLTELLDVWLRSARDAYHFLDESFFEAELVAIEQAWMPVAETWVYEDEGRVVGFIALIGDEVGAIFVRPDMQGRGVGRALMDHARELRDRLELNVFKENAKGRRFYDRYGFRFVDEHVNEQTGRPELRLELRPTDGDA